MLERASCSDTMHCCMRSLYRKLALPLALLNRIGGGGSTGAPVGLVGVWVATWGTGWPPLHCMAWHGLLLVKKSNQTIYHCSRFAIRLPKSCNQNDSNSDWSHEVLLCTHRAEGVCRTYYFLVSPLKTETSTAYFSSSSRSSRTTLKYDILVWWLIPDTIVVNLSSIRFFPAGWGEPTYTLVPWRQGFRHPTRSECMGSFAQILPVLHIVVEELLHYWQSGCSGVVHSFEFFKRLPREGGGVGEGDLGKVWWCCSTLFHWCSLYVL